jgi:hypothetical protein
MLKALREHAERCFGVSISDFASIPRHNLDRTRYIFPGKVPGPLSSDKVGNPHGQRSFRSAHFQDVSLNQWMALTPPELVQAHLNLNQTMMGALNKEKRPVVK